MRAAISALTNYSTGRNLSVAGTEICYCILSLTAKLYLGWFLLINVLYVDGSTADETLQGGGAGVSASPPP